MARSGPVGTSIVAYTLLAVMMVHFFVLWTGVPVEEEVIGLLRGQTRRPAGGGIASSGVLTASDTAPEDSTVAIILQQSVVDPAGQLRRLHTIDEGWARWCDGEDIKMQIYAALDGTPAPNLPNNEGRPFRILRPLDVQASDSKPTGMTHPKLNPPQP